MRKFIFAVMLVVGLASLAQAAVVLYEEGTKVGIVEKVNVVGTSLTATVAGKTGTVTATAAPAITGGTINNVTNLAVGTTRSTNTVNVDGTIYANPATLSAAGAGGSRLGINVDGTIYKY